MVRRSEAEKGTPEAWGGAPSAASKRVFRSSRMASLSSRLRARFRCSACEPHPRFVILSTAKDPVQLSWRSMDEFFAMLRMTGRYVARHAWFPG